MNEVLSQWSLSGPYVEEQASLHEKDESYETMTYVLLRFFTSIINHKSRPTYTVIKSLIPTYWKTVA